MRAQPGFGTVCREHGGANDRLFGMTTHGRLLPSFLLGGFECSTPINREGRRIDELRLTRHDLHVRSDYRRLRAHGILAARDGVRWNLVDRKGRLDFASAIPAIEAAEEEGLTIIWDLFHYGYPDDLNPFEEPFIERFAAYCHAFARLLARRGHGHDHRHGRETRFYTPVNEISFMAWAGGDQGLFAPHATGRAPELKRRLAEAAIAGVNAIRDADPLARMVHCDPMVHVTAPSDAPWLADSARHFNENAVLESWDMLAGRLHPELGGSPAHLDILGVNYYGVNQWEHQRPDSVLAEDDPRRVPLSDLLHFLHRRYRRPIILSETASCDDDRPRWLAHIADECLAATAEGVNLQGLCLYPVVGMNCWTSGEFRAMGLWDHCSVTGRRRVPHEPTLQTLARIRQRLERGYAPSPYLREYAEPIAA